MITCSKRDFIKTAAALAAPFWIGGCAFRKKKLSLLFFTDIHALPSEEVRAKLSSFHGLIHRLRPEMILGGGDFVHNGLRQTPAQSAPSWAVYRDFHLSVGKEIHAACGNHDLVGTRPDDGTPPEADPRKVFCDFFNLDKTWRSFDALGKKFIFLDASQIVHGEVGQPIYRGRVEEDQMDWLRSELSATPFGKPIILLTHIPLITSFGTATLGAHEKLPPGLAIENNMEVLALFEKHNLASVLQGHLRVNEQIVWRNTLFVTGGAVCGKWWKGNLWGTPPGLGTLSFDGDRPEWRYAVPQ